MTSPRWPVCLLSTMEMSGGAPAKIPSPSIFSWRQLLLAPLPQPTFWMRTQSGLLARIAFSQRWRNEEPPIEELILKKILGCAETSSLKEEENTYFYQTWSSFYYWLEKRDYA
ncbi:hypothetical protein EYD10_16697 [Varanus komodoensis]|nr:hypothetical protein EYD10_16697 [Varanus komodoensis]